MIDITSTTQLAVLKTDSRGRVQTPPEQRNALMDAFDQSAMSGAAFARLHGIKYSTFAHWRKVRKQPERAQLLSEDPCPFFEEVTVAPPDASGLMIALPGGASTQVSQPNQFAQVAALLKYLEHAC